MAAVTQDFLLPVRCYTCGKVTGHMQGVIERAQGKSKEHTSNVLTEHGFPPSRICCRRTLLAPIIGPVSGGGNVVEIVKESQEETQVPPLAGKKTRTFDLRGMRASLPKTIDDLKSKPQVEWIGGPREEPVQEQPSPSSPLIEAPSSPSEPSPKAPPKRKLGGRRGLMKNVGKRRRVPGRAKKGE